MTAAERLQAEKERLLTTTGFYVPPYRMANLMKAAAKIMDKVLVKDGHLVDCDCGEMYALCMIAGKTFRVQGTALVEAE